MNDEKYPEEAPEDSLNQEGKTGSNSNSESDVDEDECDTSDGGEAQLNESTGDEGLSEGENSDDSLNGTLDKCPICLRVFRLQEVGTPDSCEHSYCLKCIMEWADNVSTCPIDRRAFHSILVMDSVRGQVLRVQELIPRVAKMNEEYDEFSDPTHCEVCGCCDREDRLLLCDDCDMGYHLECLDPPLEAVPIDDWYCATCAAARPHEAAGTSSSINWEGRSRARIPRTGLSRRIMIRRRRDGSPSPMLKRPTSDTTRTRSAISEPGTRRPRPTVRRKKRRSVRRTRKGKGRKRRSRKQRVAIERRPATSRGRLIQQLGILPPRPGQVYVGLPSYRPTFTPNTERTSGSPAAIRTLRHQAGIAPLRIYATANDLADCFEGSSDEDSGPVGVIRIQPIRLGDPRKRVLASVTAQPASSVNVLGPILSRQHILLKDKNIQIHSGDGRLVPSISLSPEKFLCLPTENESNNDSVGSRGAPLWVRSHGSGTVVGMTTAHGGNNSSSNSSSTPHAGNSSQRTNPTTTVDSSTSNSSTGITHTAGNSSSRFGGYNTRDAAITFEDLSGMEESGQRKVHTSKNGKPKEQDETDDDEFNIYSDIEDEPRPLNPQRISPEHLHEIPDPSALDAGEGESDTDMVIDETVAGGIGRQERESRSSVESIALPAPGFLPDFGDGDAISRDGSSPVIPEAEPDSPLSIPLPDSTPPPSVRDVANPDDEDTGDLLFGEKDDEQKQKEKEEYDPSHPLSSSEDEEVPLPPQPPTPAIAISTQKLKPTSGSTDVLPLSTTENDSRRPTIQFSIPSRHRIFSMGALMKRNTGVMKKEVKAAGGISFQSEMSKAFARKPDEPGSSTAGAEPEKLSLVAEIFGSDEDEEQASEVAAPAQVPQCEVAPPIPVHATEVEPVPPPVTESSNETVEGSKWRKIVESDTPAPQSIDVNSHDVIVAPPLGTLKPSSLEESDDDVVLIGEALPEVQIIETPPPELEDDVEEEIPLKGRSRIRVKHQPSKSPAGSSQLDRVKENQSPALDSLSDSENEFERQRLRERRLQANEKKQEKRRNSKTSRSKSPKRDNKENNNKRSLKRRVSNSAESNFEEGEIFDVPEKKRRKSKKLKKSKKKHKATRSRSTSSPETASFVEKKIPEDMNGSLSSEEEGEKSVSWKKPSRSSKDRNYRDGKPKTEEKYFREREKKHEEETLRELHPGKSPPRSRDSENIEKDRKRGKGDKEESSRHSRSYERSRRRRPHSKHSNRSSSSLRNYRSRSRSHRSRSAGKSKQRYREQPFSPVRRHPSLDRSRRNSSRSPASKSQRSRRRSRSEKSRNRTARSPSNSRSRSTSIRNRRRKRDKLQAVEPLPVEGTPPRKSRKELKERKAEDFAVELPSPVIDTQLKEKLTTVSGEKEKKKKKKRREKSISPAKAIFADGDSIVVSLSFQKGKESNFLPEKDSGDGGPKTTEVGEKKKSNRDPQLGDTGDKPPKSLKKTILIDLESSPIQEQNIGVSPTLIVLSDDEDAQKGGRENDSDQDRLAVSTTSVGEGLKSPFYRNGRESHAHGVPADSTQLHPVEGSKTDFGRLSDIEVSTPARSDALVTSTRDSVDRNGTADEYAMSPFSPPKDSPPNDMSLTPPLPSGSPPFLPQDESPNKIAAAQPPIVPPVPNPMSGRTLGMPTIPTVFAQPNITSLPSNMTAPSPMIIPAPIQQLRLQPPPNLFNQSVLATVANALYGPLLGAGGPRFGIGAPQGSVPMNPNSASRLGPPVIGKKLISGVSVLLPKDQNYGTQRRNNEDGDSPFSPNSSEGDDLFEPPTDSNQPSPAKSGGGVGLSAKEKGVAGEDPAPGGKKGRAPAHIFDSLFGGPIKPPAGGVKTQKVTKSKSGQKGQKSKRGGKKAAVSLNEGELRLTEEVPTSAVELRVKEKFLKKLNRQERVVEEVKVSLKPHYSKKHITKDEYKEILRRAVPKICHNKTGEINPVKIKELIEAYVKQMRKGRKK